MSEFVPFCKDMQIMGIFVAATIECMGPYKPFAMKILSENGITSLVPDQWYDAAAFLKVFKDMDERFGPSTILQIGKKTIEFAPFPPGVDSIEAGLHAINVSYTMHHRGSDIGFLRYTKTGERSGTMVVHTPYPCDFDRGAIITAGERFKQIGQTVKVVHDDTKPCRKKGGDECTYHISW